MKRPFCDACDEPLLTEPFVSEVIALKGGATLRVQLSRVGIGRILNGDDLPEPPEICRSCMLKILHDPKHPMRQL